MNKFILTTMMILATAGCFAKLPDMKNFDGKKSVTNHGETTYSHKYENQFPLYRTGRFDFSYFSGFDPITKLTYSVAGTSKGEDIEPFCFIEDGKGQEYKSDSYCIIEKEDHTVYYFNFTEKNKDHRFIMMNYGHKVVGFFQSFE